MDKRYPLDRELLDGIYDLILETEYLTVGIRDGVSENKYGQGTQYQEVSIRQHCLMLRQSLVVISGRR